MRVHRRVLVAVAIVASAPLLSSTAGAEPAEPACGGQLVATLNHNSGIFGASGNPSSSAGPGYFFGSGTAEAVRGAMSICG